MQAGWGERLTRARRECQAALTSALIVVISVGCGADPPDEERRIHNGAGDDLPAAPIDGLDEPPPASDPCDGFDNDVDGDVDEGCYCEAGQEQACWPGDPRLVGIGSCRAGRQICESAGGDFHIGHWGPCLDHGAPSAELCGNDLDEDCDGVVAECGTPSDPADP